jgi:rod shape determining protein RodA
LAIIPLGSLSLKPYQKDRILSFINPYQDHLGTGYNSIQATIAVGSGQLTGRGLGKGTQSHLRFLPERHTDFIFASFVEELGFLGGSILIGAYIWLAMNLVNTAKVASTSIQSLICLISAGLILTQSLVNIGMNMSLLPITGVTLPLVSYGGSSLLSSIIILGINWSIIIRAHSKTRNLEIR